MNQRIRVVVAKPGLDGHDRGAKVIAAAFRDAGFEVIYTGIRQTPKQIVSVALQEDADVVAVSILSGAHNKLCNKLMDLLKEEGMEKTLCLVGGIIPTKDIEYLKSIGISEVFGPGSDTNVIVQYIKDHVSKEEYTL
jgi:methylmalonyl-CoA mutase C-terminal domain/subunit